MKIKKIIVFILAFTIIYSGSVFASSILSDAEDFFTNYDPSQTSDYVYNESDASGDEDGKYYCYNYTLKSIQISIPTLGSTSIGVRIEGRTDSSDDLPSWGNIYSKTYTSATTIDDIVMITEYLEYLRVGLIVVGDSTDDVTIKGNFGIPKGMW